MLYTFKDELKKWKNPYNNIYGAKDLSTTEDSVEDVNTTISPISKEDANIEAEQGEIVFDPKGNLNRILGKSHSKGGTPLNLPEDSFIFSKYKPLAVSKEDKELFKFKKGGTTKLNNTPAKLVEREIDVKHHNRMLAIQGNIKYDKISKDSADLMLQKNIKKLGQIAFLQEEKKGFPQGLPAFANASPEIETEDMKQSKQYKNGGFIPQFQIGGSINRNGKKYNYLDQIPDGAEFEQMEPFSENGRNGNYAYFHINGQPITNNGVKFNGQRSKLPAIDYLKTLVNSPLTYEERVRKGHIADTPTNRSAWEQMNGQFSQPEYIYTGALNPNNPSPKPTPFPSFNTVPRFNTPPPNSRIPSSPEEEILPYEPDVPFSPWQKLNLGYAGLNTLIPEFRPKLERENFIPLSQERVNVQPYLNQLNNQTYQGFQNNRLLNPVSARANNSLAYGRGVDAGNQIIGNVNNQNLQISNQENQYNNQGFNNVNNLNARNAQRYFDETQETKQNAFNERKAARNQFVSLANTYKSQNDALELQLASQPTFGKVPVLDKQGKPVYRNGKQLYRSQPLYDWNSRTNKIKFTGAGDVLGVPNSGLKDMSFEQLQDQLQRLGIDTASAKSYALSNWYKNRTK